MKVLIVEDESTVRSYLESAVKSQKHEVVTAEDGVDGLEKFQAFQPDVVLTDIQMPRMDGLGLLEKIRERDSEVVVIIITGFGSENYAVEALRLHANNYLQKPTRHEELLTLLSKYAGLVEERAIDQEIPGMVRSRSLRMEIDNRRELVPKIAQFLIRETDNALNEHDRLGVRLGLVELLMNATEHGNLAITYEEKSEAIEAGRGQLDALFKERLAMPEYADRRVRIDYEQTDAYCQWTIADEGAGFDWESVQNPLDPENVTASHGRGIFLSRFQFDEMEFMGRGNIVRVRKTLGSTAQPEATD